MPIDAGAQIDADMRFDHSAWLPSVARSERPFGT
jgi:hypothetical protein